MARLLVIDACINKRLQTELKARGRDAAAVASILPQSTKDPELLPFLAEEFAGTDWTFVTSDDRMPAEHADLISQFGVTLATVAPYWKDELDPEAYKREVVHRWAHAMAEQQPKSIRRYYLRRNSVWAPMTRRPR